MLTFFGLGPGRLAAAALAASVGWIIVCVCCLSKRPPCNSNQLFIFQWIYTLVGKLTSSVSMALALVAFTGLLLPSELFLVTGSFVIVEGVASFSFSFDGSFEDEVPLGAGDVILEGWISLAAGTASDLSCENIRFFLGNFYIRNYKYEKFINDWRSYRFSLFMCSILLGTRRNSSRCWLLLLYLLHLLNWLRSRSNFHLSYFGLLRIGFYFLLHRHFCRLASLKSSLEDHPQWHTKMFSLLLTTCWGLLWGLLSIDWVRFLASNICPDIGCTPAEADRLYVSRKNCLDRSLLFYVDNCILNEFNCKYVVSTKFSLDRMKIILVASLSAVAFPRIAQLYIFTIHMQYALLWHF